MSPDSPPQAPPLTPPPPLGLRARIWLGAIPLVFLGSQTLFAIYGPELPGSPAAIVGAQDLILGGIAVALTLGVFKIDRHAIGLSLGNRRTTQLQTAIQVLILAELTVLYTGAIVLSARMGRFRIPIEPTSLTEFHDAWVFALVAVIISPLYEEVLFRGMLMAALDWPGKRWMTVLASTALFVLPHLGPGIHPGRLLNPLIAGLLLGCSYLRTRSVLTPFVLHALFNSGVIVKDFLMAYEAGFIRRVLGYD